MRCDICDSTETQNNLEAPITFWVRLESGYDRCGPCYTSVGDNLYELGEQDLDKYINYEHGEIVDVKDD